MRNSTPKSPDTQSTPLSSVFRIKPRYNRSVNLVRDYFDPAALDGYIMTPQVNSVVERLSQSLMGTGHVRSFTITGPYGTGKSACALFLAHLLNHGIGSQKAIGILKSSHPLTHKLLCASRRKSWPKGLAVLPITGGTESVSHSIACALSDACDQYLGNTQSKATLQKKLKAFIRRASLSAETHKVTVIQLLDEFLGQLHRRNQFSGAFLIIDELGKLLENAIRNPSQSDVIVLQEISEHANRSGSFPLLFLTVLHQAIEDYAVSAGEIQRREWSKIQGRFEDIAFVETNDTFISLIGDAIKVAKSSKPIEVYARETVSAFSAKSHIGQKEAILRRGAPIHPSVLLCLPQLFRSYLSQNQRSLFAFLASNEPHGFQEFLGANTIDKFGRFPFYCLPNLYDYVRATMGSTILTHYRGKAWAEIEAALDRVPRDSEPLYRDLVKTVGLLSILGNKQELRASRGLLQASLEGEFGYSHKRIGEAIERLLELRIIVYRKYADCYSLWEGSDIDLLALYNEAHSKVGSTRIVEQDIRDRLDPFPFVARKHFFKTGTLRSYDAVVIDETAIEGEGYVDTPIVDARLVFVFPHVATDLTAVVSRVKARSLQLKRSLGGQVVFAIVKDPQPILDALSEVRCWDHVAKHTPQLEGDRIAQKELWAQISASISRLDRQAEQVFNRVHAHISCVWILNGKLYEPSSSRELNEILSNNLDSLYDKAVVVHNELVNQTKLSAAAVAARSMLIKHMLEDENSFRLGIEGTPPSVSMYVSVLESTGIHAKRGSSYSFVRPNDDKQPLSYLWNFLDGILGESQHRKTELSSLWQLLTKPPFGLRDGIVPILLIAYFKTNESEIALYENGSYLPELTSAVAERMTKSPAKFQVQRYALGEVEAQVFRMLADLFDEDLPHKKRTLLSVVRPLVRFVSGLPPFSRGTSNLSDTTKRVRAAILSARDPHALIFESLPAALGLNNLVQAPRSAASKYLSRLKESLRELEGAHERLLMQLLQELAEAFALAEGAENSRNLLRARAAFVLSHVTNMRLKAFVLQLCDVDRPDNIWAESLGSCVIGKPPSQWTDSDVLRFKVALAELVSLFRRTEEAIYFQQRVSATDSQLLRVAITKSTGEEFAQIVHVENGKNGHLGRALDVMEAGLEKQGLDLDQRIIALSELLHRYLQQKAIPSADPTNQVETKTI